MPFHLALIPAPAPTVSGAYFLDEIEVERAEDLDLEIDKEDFSKAVQEALADVGEDADGRRRRFGMVSLLPRRPELSGDELNKHYVDHARSIGADFMLKMDLEYSHAVATERNSQFWVELPLYLFLGPLSYWVDDRTYWLDARVFGFIYDLNAMGDDGRFEDSALVLRLASDISQVDMDFIDRTSLAAPTSVLASALVPPGFLASENKRIPEILSTTAIQSLASAFASTVLLKQRHLYEARQVGGVALDPLRWEVEHLEDGTARVTGRLWFDGESESLGDGLGNLVAHVQSASFPGRGAPGTGPMEAPYDPSEGAQATQASVSRASGSESLLEAGARLDFEQMSVEDLERADEEDGQRDGAVPYDFEVSGLIAEDTYALTLEVDVLGNRSRHRTFTFVVNPQLRDALEKSTINPVSPAEPLVSGSVE